MAAPCRCPRNSRASPPGTTTRTPPPTARCIAKNIARVLPILAPVLDVVEPDGAFYLWPDVQRDDEAFTRDLYATQNLTILPGSYLARDTPRGNPGPASRAHLAGRAGRRMRAAAQRIRDSELSWRNLSDRPDYSRRHHRRSLRAARGHHREEFAAGPAPRHRRVHRAAGFGPGARRGEKRRPVDREPVAQESRAAVFPHARQPVDRRRLHALLRQGAAQIRRALAGGRRRGAARRRHARRAAGRRAPRLRTSPPTPCSCRAT